MTRFSGALSPRIRLLLAALLLSFATALAPALPLFGPLPASAADATKTSAQKYTCPMHPHYISEDPGTCPICGMDLVPLKTSDGGAADTSAGANDGRAAVTVPPETIQNMGVRTAAAEKTRFGRQIRAYGIVKENERLQHVINNRLEGWIEELTIRAVGDQVKRGDLLYRVYSPELYVSQRDYLTTLQSGDRQRQKAANLRLRSYGVQPKAIRQLERDREAMMDVPFYADEDGVVAKIEVTSGSYVGRGAMIAMIQDYASVWLVVSVAEQDMAFLTEKSPAKVVFPTLQRREATARVDYIYPTIDAASRTGQVRLVIDNKDGMLRPGTYADVTFEVGARDRLAIPTEALLMSETGAYVVVAEGAGRFRPQPVTTGLNAGGRSEVVKGLDAGARVVTSGQFLIDSESALKESFNKLQKLQTPLNEIDVDKTGLAMIDHLVDAALYIHEAETDGYDVEAKFLDPARSAKTALWPAYRHSRLGPVLEAADTAIGRVQAARAVSERLTALGELVEALKPWLLEGKPEHYREKKLALFEDRQSNRLWLQLGSKPANPYGNGAATQIDWPAAPAPAPAKAASDMSMQSTSGKMGGGHVH